MLQSWFQDAELKRRLAFPSESWFEFVTTDPVQRAQIAYESSTPVGFVHYEHESDGRVALAFGVRPDLRGRGYGKRILRAVLASPELASVERVWGGVEPDNVASIRCLTAVGFTSEPYPEEPSMVKMIYHRRPARPAL
jgi:RimJ/RimL family protein N-acetyltransferase